MELQQLENIVSQDPQSVNQQPRQAPDVVEAKEDDEVILPPVVNPKVQALNPVNDLVELPPEAEVTEEVRVDYHQLPPVDNLKKDENLLDIEKKVYLPKVENQNEENDGIEEEHMMPKLSIHDIPDDRQAQMELTIPNKEHEQTTPAQNNSNVSNRLPSSIDSHRITDHKADIPAVEASSDLKDDTNLDGIQKQEEGDSNHSIEKLGQPLWLTDQFVDRPCLVLLSGLFVIFIFVGVAAYFETYLPSPVTQRDFLDYENINTLLFDAREAAQGEIQEKQFPSGQIPLQSISHLNWWLIIAIECNTEGCDNILTPQGVRFLDEIDKTIASDPTWKKVCLLDAEGKCAENVLPGGTTAKGSFADVLKYILGPDLSEITQYAIDFALFGLASKPDLFQYALPLFSQEFNINNRKAKMTRLVLQTAGPVELDNTRYSHMRDRNEQQEYLVADWEVNLNTKLMKIQKEKYPDFSVHCFGRSYIYRWFYNQLIYDVMWAVAAALVVYAIVTLHVESLFIGTTSMLMILFSIPITLVIYRKIFSITNVSALHLCIVFVVLGISADNIFVLWDAWCQSATFAPLATSYNKRMAYTFRRAYKAILATSSTTAFAFLSNGFSSLMPISAFGYFAFFIVPVNYILIVFYFPAYIIVHEKYFKSFEQRCCRRLTDCFTCRHCRVFCVWCYNYRRSRAEPSEKVIPYPNFEDSDVDMVQIIYKKKKARLWKKQADNKVQKGMMMQNIDQVASCSTAKVHHQENLTSALQEQTPSNELQPQATHSDRPLNPQEKDQNALRKKFNEHRLEGGDLDISKTVDIEAAKMDEEQTSVRTMDQYYQFNSIKDTQTITQTIHHPSSYQDLGETIIVDQTTSQMKSNNAELKTVEMTEQLLVPKIEEEQLGKVKETKTQIFFDTTWNNFVRKFRWPIVITGLLMGVYAGYRSSEIKGLTSMEQYTPYDHYVMVAFRKILFGFNEGDQAQTIVVDVMWGVEGINKTNVDYYNASDIGSTIWDKEFDLSPSQNQLEAYDLCQYIKKQDDMLFKKGSIVCWIDDFRTFAVKNVGRFPTSKEQFYPTLFNFVNNTEIGKFYQTQNHVGIINRKLVFMKFVAKASGGLYDPYFLKSKVWLKWEQLVDKYNKESAPGINKTLQTSGLDWCLMITEIKLVETMQQGLVISISFALLALLIATGNIIQAVMSSFTIGLIIVNVMAIVAYAGWELGSGESVGVVVCVGFAVDYVVHLAAHYIHSSHTDRNSRIKGSLRELGVSILGGSVTTIAAALILFICVLSIFQKFAIFVIATIIFSVLYSLGFFASLCHVMGPVGPFGDVAHMVKTVKGWLKYKQN